MVVFSGHGTSIVGSTRRKMVPFTSSEHLLTDKWYVIGKDVPHEFVPEREDMTVVSFHTCEASELEEIACESGGKRFYEGHDA